MPYHLQQVNAQSQSGSSGFHRPISAYLGSGGGLRAAWGNDQEIEQKQKLAQRATARGLEKDADVDVHAFRRSNAQGQAQIVQSDYNWLEVEAEAEAEQEQEVESGSSYQAEYGSPGSPVGGPGPGPVVGGPWPRPQA